MIEALEGRLLYRASHVRPVFSVDAAGTLRVSGTAGNDTLFVGGRSRDVTLILNGRVSVIHTTVRRAVIYGGAGNDVIDCGKGGEYDVPFNAGETTFSVFADGGAGRDTLYSGGGDFDNGGDTLLGGSGDDFLGSTEYGLGPPVYMDGGPGNDRLNYGQIMHGGSGDDVATTDSFYGEPTFISGLETYIDKGNFSTGQSEVARDNYVSDLTTRNGKLVFSYLTDGTYHRNVSGPYLRDDGRIGITVSFDTPKDGVHDHPAKRWFVPLSDRYTARARQQGLVLSFVGSAVNPPAADWLILAPTSE